MNLVKISVGEKFPKSLNLGVPAVWYGDGSLSIIMKNSNWTNKELRSVGKEPFSIYLSEKDNVYGLLVEFSAFSFDCYFNINDSDDAQNLIDSYEFSEDGYGMSMTIYIVDENDIVKEIRMVGLYTDMSNKIVDILKNQYNDKEGLYERGAYLQRANDLMQQYDFKQMKKFAIEKDEFYKSKSKQYLH